MKVLIGCEFSGVVRDAFLACGHDAVSCDLRPCDKSGPHLVGNILDYLGQGWDLLIAHPPCTYLSNAGARHLYHGGNLSKERFNLGQHAACLFRALYDAPIKRVCIENPVPSKVFGLPKYDEIINPYEFGHVEKKRTCLWLRGLPILLPTCFCVGACPTMASSWFNSGHGEARAARRAVTFAGVAMAMAKQWGTL